jgi:hypothetical protein
MPDQILSKPKQISEVEILNPNDRIFKCWGTVEVVDKSGQFLPIDEFRKIMPTIIKRGGVITYRHSNKNVGRLLNYVFQNKQTKEGPREGLLLTAQVFNDYPFDDIIWEGVKNGDFKGLSFGGGNMSRDFEFKDGDYTEVLRDIMGFEFSIVPNMNNQEATMEEINYIAKSEIGEIKKPFAGYKNFQECVNQNQDKNDPSAYCAVIMRKVEKENETLKQDDPARVCGDIWFNGTEEQRSAFGSTEGRGRDERPPKEWFNSCKLKVGQSFSKEKNEKYINGSSITKDMSGEIKKQEEGIITPTPETNPLEEVKQLLMKILEQVTQTPTNSNIEKQDDDEKDKKDEDKNEKNEKNDIKKQEKVTLPKTPEEETDDGKPAQGAETDKINFVQKIDEIKKEMGGLKKDIVSDVMNEIKKEFKMPGASTPRPDINEKQILDRNQNIKDKKIPSNWGELHELEHKMLEKRR